MKFDTKKASTVSKNEHMLKNDLVPTKDEKEGARSVFYEPTIFYSPLFLSKRTQKERAITASDVDELTNMLSGLTMSKTEESSDDDSLGCFKKQDGSKTVRRSRRLAK